MLSNHSVFYTRALGIETLFAFNRRSFHWLRREKNHQRTIITCNTCCKWKKYDRFHFAAISRKKPPNAVEQMMSSTWWSIRPSSFSFHFHLKIASYHEFAQLNIRMVKLFRHENIGYFVCVSFFFRLLS